jgi:16S rRNA (uracil1498-N3)-methyltransferase
MSRPPTSGPHFFVPREDVRDDVALLRGDQARHLAAVLRAERGQPVSVADGTGQVWQGRVAHRTDDEVSVALVERFCVPAPCPRLTVVHALPKGRKLDDVVQRLTEVGVDRLVPVHSARSQVRLTGTRAAKALARWRAVALAASKQSRRARLLDVVPIGEWAGAFAGTGAGAVLWEGAVTPLGSVLADVADPAEITLGVGAEGGLTPEEVEAAGLPAASLGPTILRTETAALVACSVALHVLGRLG